MKGNHIHIISGRRGKILDLLIRTTVFVLALYEYRSFGKVRLVLKRLVRLGREINGTGEAPRMVRIGWRYYWDLHIPGFPSRRWLRYIRGEMNRVLAVRSGCNRLVILFLCVTKKCPLRCLHCYEWDELNRKEVLKVDDLKAIASKFQASGVAHIHLGGGEPMARFEDTVELIRSVSRRSEVWMATCGWGLDPVKARLLKNAGLTGVAISVDHFDAEVHNAFRGNPHSFEWALSATHNSRAAGLATCWSLCCTRDFISRENLICYAGMAMNHGVHFIQFFEPLPVGHFRGKDVRLDEARTDILERFYREINTARQFRKYPLVAYIAQYQRRIGCLGAGNFYVYVDTNGNAQPCPFCRTGEKANAALQPVAELLDMVGSKGCSGHKKFNWQFIEEAVPKL